MVSVYSKPQCPACDEAKALLTNAGIEFKVLMLGVDFDMDDLMDVFVDLGFPPPRSFPIIVHSDSVMTLTELKANV